MVSHYDCAALQSQAGGTKAFAAFQGFAGFGSKSAEGTRTTSISSSLFNGTSAQTSSTSSTSIFGGAMSVGAASFSFGPQKPASSGNDTYAVLSAS